MLKDHRTFFKFLTKKFQNLTVWYTLKVRYFVMGRKCTQVRWAGEGVQPLEKGYSKTLLHPGAFGAVFEIFLQVSDPPPYEG